MARKILTIFAILNLIATIVMSVWALLILHFAGLMMWDTNVEAFKFALNEEQRESILWRLDNTLQGAVFPLLVTNVGWIALTVGYFCCRTNSLVAKADAVSESDG